MFNIRLTHCVNYLFYFSDLKPPRTLLCVCSKYILYKCNACTTAEILWGHSRQRHVTTEEEHAEVTVDIWCFEGDETRRQKAIN